MQEKLVSFKTAKVARDKGFSTIFTSYSNVYYEKNGDLTRSQYNSQIGYFQIEVPTQSLLQKWLREYKNIHIAVIPKKKDKRFFFEGLIVGDDVNISIGSNFTDYEECLEQCLLKALKHYTI